MGDASEHIISELSIMGDYDYIMFIFGDQGERWAVSLVQIYKPHLFTMNDVGDVSNAGSDYRDEKSNDVVQQAVEDVSMGESRLHPFHKNNQGFYPSSLHKQFFEMTIRHLILIQKSGMIRYIRLILNIASNPTQAIMGHI